jgi:hypothetical protein
METPPSTMLPHSVRERKSRAEWAAGQVRSVGYASSSNRQTEAGGSILESLVGRLMETDCLV